MSTIRRAVASVSSANGPIGMIPALLISTSIGPSRSDDLVEEVGERVPSVTSSSRPIGLAAELGRRLLGERLVEVADRDPGALARQRGRGRLADPAGAARDRHDLPLVNAAPWPSGLLLVVIEIEDRKRRGFPDATLVHT